MSMHNNKLVVAIKTAGKVLREQGDKVYLPFGSEYSIYLKNLNSVRALVRVSLDGNSVTDGEDLVVYGNSELNLERFLKKGNMESGNRFKFIERTAKVEQHRGIEAEDGLLRVEFQFEKVTPKPIVVETIHRHRHEHDYYRYYPPYWYDPYPYPYKPYWGCEKIYCSNSIGGSPSFGALNNAGAIGGSSAGGAIGGTSFTVNTVATGLSQNAVSGSGVVSSTLTSSPSAESIAASGQGVTRMKRSTMKGLVAETQALNQVINDAGITVAGSVSDQKFQTAAWFAVDDEKFVIVLKLLGEIGGQIVEQAITTKTKQTCEVCGTRNRGKLAQFCRECGAALEIVGGSSKRVTAR